MWRSQYPRTIQRPDGGLRVKQLVLPHPLPFVPVVAAVTSLARFQAAIPVAVLAPGPSSDACASLPDDAWRRGHTSRLVRRNPQPDERPNNKQAMCPTGKYWTASAASNPHIRPSAVLRYSPVPMSMPRKHILYAYSIGGAP